VIKKVKKVSDSAVEDNKYQVFPGDLNDKGTLFGGRAMEVFDWVAGYVAMKHSNLMCVTKSNFIEFAAPSYEWEVLTFKASVNHVWRSSMEIGVKAFAENLKTGEVRHVISGYSVLVTVDPNDKKPIPVGVDLELSTADEIRRYHEADLRKKFWSGMRRKRP